MGAVLFVAGTDTGVGKTRVAATLCRALRARGLRVGVMKPAETGCARDAPSDALALIEASGCAEPLDIVCPYRFTEPLAPAVAAMREGRVVDPAVIGRSLARLRANHDIVICEGAGGLLVPLTETLLTADWIEAERLPVLLVGRLGLGTLNHTLLSALYLADRSIPLLGTVLCAVEPPSSVSEETNPAALARFPEAKLIGVMGHGESGLPEEVVSAVLAHIS